MSHQPEIVFATFKLLIVNGARPGLELAGGHGGTFRSSVSVRVPSRSNMTASGGLPPSGKGAKVVDPSPATEGTASVAILPLPPARDFLCSLWTALPVGC